MNQLIVSGVAIGQYKQLCPLSTSKCKTKDELLFKIIRAASLGKTTHYFDKQTKIIRYYYLNLLVKNNKVLTIWNDKTFPPVTVKDKRKALATKLLKKEMVSGE